MCMVDFEQCWTDLVPVRVLRLGRLSSEIREWNTGGGPLSAGDMSQLRHCISQLFYSS